MGLREAIRGFASGMRQAQNSALPDKRIPVTNKPEKNIPAIDTSINPKSGYQPGSWSSSWMGPGRAVSPTVNEATTRDKDREMEPRSFQFIPSINSTIVPRIGYGRLPFSVLRDYAETVPEVSMCIRLLTEELKSFVPTIEDDQGNPVDDENLKWMTSSPDRFNPWPVWLSQFMYNVLVYDAGCSFLMRDSTGKVNGSRVIDGSTIFILIDEDGNPPMPPAPAYEQVIWNTPYGLFNTRELWYKPRQRRGDPYGYSPIEDALVPIQLLKRLWNREYQKYKVGNIPEMAIALPEGFVNNGDVNSIFNFEEDYNDRMSGSDEELARLRFLPAGSQVLSTKDITFNQASYDVATNAVRLAYGIPQSEVGQTPSMGLGGKGYAEAMQSAFYRQALAPMISYLESHFNDIITINHIQGRKFKLEFPPDTIDPQKELDKWTTLFKSGLARRDESRTGVGLEKIGGEEGNLFQENDPQKDDLQSALRDLIPVKQEVQKIEKMEKKLIPVITGSMNEAKEVGDSLGVDWEKIDLKEFSLGLQEEHEHARTVENDEETMAQIALDHLAEDPHYYTKLKAVFAKCETGGSLKKLVGTEAEDDIYFGADVDDQEEVEMPHQGASGSYIVSIGGPGMKPRPAVWKPVTEEKKSLQEWAGGELYRRAEAVYLIDRELAPDAQHYLVPLTYTSQVDDVPGSVQHYLTGHKPRKIITEYDDSWIEQAAVLDYVTCQRDRRGKNYLTHPFDSTRPVLIDNDISFPVDANDEPRSIFVEAWRGKELSQKMLDALYLILGDHDLWEDLKNVLEDESVLQECTAVELARERAQRLYDEKMIPDGKKIKVNPKKTVAVKSGHNIKVRLTVNSSEEDLAKGLLGKAEEEPELEYEEDNVQPGISQEDHSLDQNAFEQIARQLLNEVILAGQRNDLEEREFFKKTHELAENLAKDSNSKESEKSEQIDDALELIEFQASGNMEKANQIRKKYGMKPLRKTAKPRKRHSSRKEAENEGQD
jgi:hypothetical protein